MTDRLAAVAVIHLYNVDKPLSATSGRAPLTAFGRPSKTANLEVLTAAQE